jgi:predicted ATPase/DNA-binding SARP family transcriptional activator
VEFRVLGPLEVVHNGDASAPPGVKERTILARLLLEPARVVPTDALLEAAWPETDPETAARSLAVRLANLRAFLEPDRPPGAPSTLLVRDGAGYRLAAELDQIDAVRLERLVGEAAALAPEAALAAYGEALALWRGAPFGDVAYAEFAQAEIRRLEALRARAAEGRARALLALGRHEEALPELQRLVAADPLSEELVRGHALALYRAGRQVDALDALRALGSGLAELGLEPSAATRELERGILVHDPALAGARPPTAARRLPARASRFFGREEHLDRAEQMVRESRLVTIAGSGGAGKTRLALELAERLAGTFPDGPWWCELGPVASDADVPGAVADALALDGGLESLTPRTGPLLLDNCEHLLDGAAAVVEELLARSPGLRVVATSRAPLGVDGEQVLRLLGLSADAAAALFRDRAAAAGAVADDAAVAELCARLDGLPLAIELAAGRTRSLAPSEIVERLDERFDVLAVWGRRSAPRHWTLRAAIAWSYDLLEEPQRRLFERLSVFARGCTLPEAEAVCAGDGLERAFVGGLLDELVAHSLLTTSVVSGRTTYAMLETLREYAAERLEERGERDELRERHAAYYVEQARALVEIGWREQRLPFVDSFDELRAAVRWCLSRDGDPGRAFALAEVAWWPALARHGEETARLIDEVLARWPGVHGRRPHVLGAASTVALTIGDREGARRQAEAAIALEAGIGEPALLARRTLAQAAYYSGERDPGPWSDVARLARAAGYPSAACEADGFLAQLLHAKGDHGAALVRARQTRDEAERLGFPWLISWGQFVTGVVVMDSDPAAARRWLEQALAGARENHNHHMVRFSLRALGVAASLEGDHDAAVQHLKAAIDYDEERSEAASQRTSLMALAAVLAERGQLETAAVLLGATEHWPAAPYLAAFAARARERVAALGPEELADALARGRALDLEGAKALARAAI